MKEVFVVYGSVDISKITLAQRPPTFQVFDNFDAAFVTFQKYIKDAFDMFKSYPIEEIELLDAEKVKESYDKNLFDIYNIDLDIEEERKDICWDYNVINGEKANWELCLTDGIPVDQLSNLPLIFPELHIEKMEVMS